MENVEHRRSSFQFKAAAVQLFEHTEQSEAYISLQFDDLEQFRDLFCVCSDDCEESANAACQKSDM